jgi:hypothetical protein
MGAFVSPGLGYCLEGSCGFISGKALIYPHDLLFREALAEPPL